MRAEELLYTKLYNYIRGWLEGRGYYVAVLALEFARRRHIRKRKDGVTPEFSHQLHIVRYFIDLARLLPDPQRVITLAILHDVVEDGYATIEEICREFGDDIANGVRDLSKKIGDIIIPPEVYYPNMLGDPGVCVAKGGDRLHNLESMLNVFTREKQQAYADETESYTLPMLKEARNRYPEYAEVLNVIRHTMIIYVKMVRAGFDPAIIAKA